jgi:hypothetical protein
MEELKAQIKELQLSVQALLKKLNNVQKENEHLKQLTAELQQGLTEKENTVRSAQQKIDAKSLSTLYDDDEKKLLQQRIDVYLRDIERCLSLLNA